MARNNEWITDLYHLSLTDLQSKYGRKAPKNRDSHRELKRYYAKKLGLSMENLPSNPEAPKTRDQLEALSREFGKAGIVLSADELSQANRAGFHIGYIKNAAGEIEYTKPLPHVEFANSPESNILKDWAPATPARITPSRRKPAERDHNVLLVFGDMQVDYRRIDDDLVPIHNVSATRALTQLARDMQPNEIINLGDTLDFSSLSRFTRDSDHFYRTLGPSFQFIHDFYAQLRSDNPEAKIVEIDSNHHKRLTDFVLKNMPDMYGVRRAGEEADYPVFTYPYLANLQHVGVDWVGGYGAATYEYKPDLAFIHGEFAVSNGSTAAKLSKANPDRNIVQGHKHSMELHYRTTRAGTYLGAMVVGALCRLDGVVPSYHSSIDTVGVPVHYQENWQNGVSVIYDYGDGHYQFDQIPVVNGKIVYKGKEYDGNG